MKKIIGILVFICVVLCVNSGWGQTRPNWVDIRSKPVFDVREYGAKTDGTDATDAINAAIHAAYISMQPSAEAGGYYRANQSVRVMLAPGGLYNIEGTILLPSSIVLDLNGSILDGGESSAMEAYASSSRALIESAYWNGSALVSNTGLSPTVYRVCKAGVINGSIRNAPCGIRLTAFQEHSVIQNIFFNGVARALHVENSWYSKISNVITRSAATATGSVALFIGGDVSCAALVVEDCAFVDPWFGVVIDTVSSNIQIQSCTFESPWAIFDGNIGVELRNKATAFSFKDNYIEDEYIGLHVASGAEFVSGSFSDTYIYRTRYSIKTTGTGKIGPGVQMMGIQWKHVLDGVGSNTLDISSADSSPTIYPETILYRQGFREPLPFFNLSTGTACIGSVLFADSSGNVQARDQGALFNASKLVSAPFTGRENITKINVLPFIHIEDVATNSITLSTLISWEESQCLVFNLRWNGLNQDYKIHGTIYGSSVYQLSPTTGSATVTIASGTNAFGDANVAILTISNINTLNASGVVDLGYIQGMVRHH